MLPQRASQRAVRHYALTEMSCKGLGIISDKIAVRVIIIEKA
jgi:hypothetical protein